MTFNPDIWLVGSFWLFYGKFEGQGRVHEYILYLTSENMRSATMLLQWTVPPRVRAF